mmetsp:Transcript_5009/g.13977  ORF Transcript_5009/g.13977 Transcript_5009/m.13977 type:complete len:205 (-) Transcript_5009:703-1317(-)
MPLLDSACGIGVVEANVRAEHAHHECPRRCFDLFDTQDACQANHVDVVFDRPIASWPWRQMPREALELAVGAFAGLDQCAQYVVRHRRVTRRLCRRGVVREGERGPSVVPGVDGAICHIWRPIVAGSGLVRLVERRCQQGDHPPGGFALVLRRRRLRGNRGQRLFRGIQRVDESVQNFPGLLRLASLHVVDRCQRRVVRVEPAL